MRKWLPLLAVCIGSFLFIVDTTVVTVALPAIGTDLAAPLAALEWVPNSYTLVLAVLVLSAGSVADRLGLRRAYLGGLAAFAVASLGCALAPTVGWLVAARAAQGIGGAALAVTGFALLTALYTGKDRGSAFGVFFAVNALGAAAGPLLGGLLTETLGWRAIFVANIPMAVAALLLAAAVVPPTARRAARIDIPGTALFAAAAAGLTIGLTRAAEHGFGDATTLGLLGGAAIAAVAFVLVEKHTGEGLLDLSLFTHLPFVAALLCAAVWSVAFAALVYTSVWLQSARGLGPLAAGFAMAPLAVATAIASTMAGRLLHGVAPRFSLGAGLLLCGAGAALQVGLDERSGPASILTGLVVTGIGVGISGPAIGGAVMGTVAPERAGSVSGLLTTVRQLGQTLGVAVLGIGFASAPSVVGGVTLVNGVAAVLGLVAGVLALLVIRPVRVVA